MLEEKCKKKLEILPADRMDNLVVAYQWRFVLEEHNLQEELCWWGMIVWMTG